MLLSNCKSIVSKDYRAEKKPNDAMLEPRDHEHVLRHYLLNSDAVIMICFHEIFFFQKLFHAYFDTLSVYSLASYPKRFQIKKAARRFVLSVRHFLHLHFINVLNHKSWITHSLEI